MFPVHTLPYRWGTVRSAGSEENGGGWGLEGMARWVRELGKVSNWMSNTLCWDGLGTAGIRGTKLVQFEVQFVGLSGLFLWKLGDNNTYHHNNTLSWRWRKRLESSFLLSFLRTPADSGVPLHPTERYCMWLSEESVSDWFQVWILPV